MPPLGALLFTVPYHSGGDVSYPQLESDQQIHFRFSFPYRNVVSDPATTQGRGLGRVYRLAGNLLARYYSPRVAVSPRVLLQGAPSASSPPAGVHPLSGLKIIIIILHREGVKIF